MAVVPNRNDGERSMLGAKMQGMVKKVIDAKPALKKWILETMPPVLKDVNTPGLT